MIIECLAQEFNKTEMADYLKKAVSVQCILLPLLIVKESQGANFNSIIGPKIPAKAPTRLINRLSDRLFNGD